MPSRERRSDGPNHLTRSDKIRLTRMRRILSGWYINNAREFPWRAGSATTFERICVEVLLQRTRAETVSRMYGVFFDRFRSWADLAAAPIEELEGHFKLIGLWRRRARSMKALAGYAADREGRFPDAVEELAEVPAVGQYVANAILMFQHGQSRPLLDVNMARLIERHIRPRRLSDIRHDPWLQGAAHWLVRGDNPAEINWAALDFASTVCKARTPRCSDCPLSRSCPSSRA